MSLGRIKVFLGSKEARKKPLRLIGESAQRLGFDCEMVTGLHYSDCDVAVIWGLIKKDKPTWGEAAIRRHELRRAILERHPGQTVVIEAPAIGRRVRAPGSKPWILHKLFPASAPWTRLLLPERFYKNDPFHHYRVGLGGFGDDGGLALAGHAPPRWQALSSQLGIPPVKPWRRDGRHILVVGQVPGDASLRGIDIHDWILRSCTELRGLTGRPIVVRLHPLARGAGMAELPGRLAPLGVTLADVNRPMAESLEDAWAVVTYSSGAAIDALLAGIPAIATSPASFAWEVTDHALASAVSPTLHDREPWLERLAAAHWSEEELESGAVWTALSGAIESSRQRRAAQ